MVLLGEVEDATEAEAPVGVPGDLVRGERRLRTDGPLRENVIRGVKFTQRYADPSQ
jgi:hypothetical protein